MEKIIIKGGCKLSGEINLSAAKNAVLPIIAASILSGDKCVIERAPMLEDVSVLCDVLKSLNADVEINKELEEISIDSRNIFNADANSELIRKMRASFLIIGPMLSRFGHFRVSLPGGCNIGSRPIDLHLKGFKALGADIYMDHGCVEAKADKLIGSEIYLDFPSVGATENIMMAAVLAEGETILENSAEEPEIKDLANYLISMGANIEGAGTDTISNSSCYHKSSSFYPIKNRLISCSF